ncbi:hypothetical protein [Stenotrophomonas maltophilia]|uniref:hypothetical protein n=1 Tax=Stenotrophomonas maltophilia TaxID=40324 RepID=UPI0011B64B27|nr:hypothetical protein [Stenotrophomonas maltophilia]
MIPKIANGTKTHRVASTTEDQPDHRQSAHWASFPSSEQENVARRKAGATTAELLLEKLLVTPID